MATPNSKASMIQYCLRSLGKGAIDINVTDEQLDDRIDEAINYMVQFHFDGVEKKYLSMQIQQGDIANGYIKMPNTCVGVTRVFPLTGDSINSNINGSFNIFDISYQLRLNELYDFTSADYVYFELANEHLRTLEMILIGEPPIRYNRYTNILYVDMSWKQKIVAGNYIVVECYTLLDPNSELFWNDTWFRKFATCLIKEQWGNNLIKFIGAALPGGIQLNGQKIYDDAVAERAKLEIEIRDTFDSPTDLFIG